MLSTALDSFMTQGGCAGCFRWGGKGPRRGDTHHIELCRPKQLAGRGMAKGKTDSIRCLVSRTGGPTRPGKNLCGKTTVNTSVGLPHGILPPRASEAVGGAYGVSVMDLGLRNTKAAQNSIKHQR